MRSEKGAQAEEGLRTFDSLVAYLVVLGLDDGLEGATLVQLLDSCEVKQCQLEHRIDTFAETMRAKVGSKKTSGVLVGPLDTPQVLKRSHLRGRCLAGLRVVALHIAGSQTKVRSHKAPTKLQQLASTSQRLLHDLCNLLVNGVEVVEVCGFHLHASISDCV